MAISGIFIQTASLLLVGVDLGMQTDRAFQQAVALVGPSVVRIDTVGGKDQIAAGLVSAGATTGVVVSPDGYLVTSAFHFASRPSSIIVTLPDGRRLAAEEVSTDRQRMMTLLKVDADRLPVPAIAPKSDIRVGQWSIAVGRTFDSETPSISVGIVSALNRVWGKAIQTDAKVSPVNYGGPLIDIQGRVMGILAPLSPHESGDTAGVEWYDSGIGFAVPLQDVLSVLEQMKRGEDLLPGLLGVAIQSKDQIGGKAVIGNVRFDSPAEKAGIKSGDQIVAVNGQTISRIAELKHILGQKYAGEKLELSFLREDETRTATVTLVGELPPYQPVFLGIQLGRDPSKPALSVRYIWPESPAEKSGMQIGDQIEQINGEIVSTRDEAQTQLEGTRPGETLQIDVQRQGMSVPLQLTAAITPNQLPDMPAELTFGQKKPDKELKLGRSSETLPGHDREYWQYVPENYHPDQPHSLVIFLHPTLNSMEQGALAAWKSECERRAIILLAPRNEAATGWSPNDLEFIRDCAATIKKQYTIADRRVAVVGLGNAAPIAGLLSFRNSELIQGLALIDAPALGRVPENTPDHSVEFFILSRGRGLDAVKWNQAIPELQKSGYPVFQGMTSEEPGQYPSSETNAQIARWVDTLDRL